MFIVFASLCFCDDWHILAFGFFFYVLDKKSSIFFAISMIIVRGERFSFVVIFVFMHK
jgi:hypothetical protein